MRLIRFLLLVLLAACGGAAAKPDATPTVIRTTQTSPQSSPTTELGSPSKCNLEKRVVGSLAAPMHITAYITTGTPSLDAQVHAIHDLLERLKDAGAPHIAYSVVNYANPDGKDKARIAGMSSFDATDSRDGTGVEAVMGLTFEYRNESDKIALLDPGQPAAIEYFVFRKLLELRTKADGPKQRIGVLTGHGEIGFRESYLVPTSMGPRPTPTIQGILAKYFPFIELVDVDLAKNAGAIDESLAGLVITQPNSDLPDAHLRRIDEFVTKGKTLVVVASAVNVRANDPLMFATLSTHGLETLLGGYGIEMRKDITLDFGAPFKMDLSTSQGSRNLFFPQILRVGPDPRLANDASRLDLTFPAFFSLSEVTFPFASSLVLHRDKQPGISADGFRILARTTTSAFRETKDMSLAPVHQWRPRDPFAQHDIAASVEGNLTSAFGSTTAKGGPPKASSRVLVLSSSQFFVNPFVYANSSTGSDAMLDQLAGVYAQAQVTNLVLAAKQMLDWVWMDRALATCARASSN